MKNELSEAEINLLKIIINPRIEGSKISTISNPLLIHSILLNYDWEDDDEFLINEIIDNQNSDVTTILMAMELISDSQYIFKEIQSDSENNIYKEPFEICDKAFFRILTGFYKSQTFKFKTNLTKTEVFKLKKMHPEIYSKYNKLIEESGTIEANTFYL